MKPLALVVALLPMTCAAGTLAPNSLLCESAESIAFAKRADRLVGKNGADAIKAAKLKLQSDEIVKKSAAIMRNQASQEAAIAGNRYARNADKSAQNAEASMDRASADSAAYATIVQTCASSGPAALPAIVLERKPISGIAKVKAAIAGVDTEGVHDL